MISHLRALSDRRKLLVARSAAQREHLAAAMDGLRREVVILDTVLATVRHLRRYRTVAGLAAGSLLLFAPRVSRRLLPRVVWIAPLAFEGFRLARALRRATPVPPELRID